MRQRGAGLALPRTPSRHGQQLLQRRGGAATAAAVASRTMTASSNDDAPHPPQHHHPSQPEPITTMDEPSEMTRVVVVVNNNNSSNAPNYNNDNNNNNNNHHEKEEEEEGQFLSSHPSSLQYTNVGAAPRRRRHDPGGEVRTAAAAGGGGGPLLPQPPPPPPLPPYHPHEHVRYQHARLPAEPLWIDSSETSLSDRRRHHRRHRHWPDHSPCPGTTTVLLDVHTVHRRPHHVPDHLYQQFLASGGAARWGRSATALETASVTTGPGRRAPSLSSLSAPVSVAERRRLRRQRHDPPFLTEPCLMRTCAGVSLIGALVLFWLGLLLDRQPLYVPGGVLPAQLAYNSLTSKMVIQYTLPRISNYQDGTTTTDTTTTMNHPENGLYRLPSAHNAYRAALAYLVVMMLCWYRLHRDAVRSWLSMQWSSRPQLQGYQDIPDHVLASATATSHWYPYRSKNSTMSDDTTHHNNDDPYQYENGALGTGRTGTTTTTTTATQHHHAYQMGLWDRATANIQQWMTVKGYTHWLLRQRQGLRRKATPKTV